MFFSEKLGKFKNLRHCFFSRKNGVSEGYYESLNCGLGSNDKKENVLKNLEFVAKKIVNLPTHLGIPMTVIKKTIDKTRNFIESFSISDAEKWWEKQRTIKKTN